MEARAKIKKLYWRGVPPLSAAMSSVSASLTGVSAASRGCKNHPKTYPAFVWESSFTPLTAAPLAQPEHGVHSVPTALDELEHVECKKVR